jgi:hypothetical protein
MDPERRSVFCNKIENYKNKGHKIVYIDESGFSHDMPRIKGYSSCGQRCYGKQNWNAKGRTNVIGALLGKSLLTLSTFNHTINTEDIHCMD